MPPAIDPLVLSPDQRSELQGWLSALGTPQQVALRCRIVLAVAAGKTEMMIAAENGVNRKTVRLWRGHNIKPHRSETFKLSRDPRFLEKLTDVIGLYLNPPDRAIVLCVDEKSQIQALQRTQPGLPLKKGRCGTMTH